VENQEKLISTKIKSFVQKMSDGGNVLDLPEGDRLALNNEFTRNLVVQELQNLSVLYRGSL